MTEIEYLLTTLMEECAELQKECSKILRFGAGDRPPGSDGPTNIQRLQTEFCDLIGVVELLEERNLKVRRMDASMLVDIRAKKDKVRKFMDYSRMKGTLESCSDTSKTTPGDFIPSIGRLMPDPSGPT